MVQGFGVVPIGSQLLFGFFWSGFSKAASNDLVFGGLHICNFYTYRFTRV